MAAHCKGGDALGAELKCASQWRNLLLLCVHSQSINEFSLPAAQLYMHTFVATMIQAKAMELVAVQEDLVLCLRGKRNRFQ